MLKDIFMGKESSDFHLRVHFNQHTEYGITIVQISESLWKSYFGWSLGMQVYNGYYTFNKDVILRRYHQRIDFVSTDGLKKNTLIYGGLRFPLLVGLQSPLKIFSLQTGLSVGIKVADKNCSYKYEREKEKTERHLHINYVLAYWTTIVGIGPFTVVFNQGLIPLFQTKNGKKAYESTITFGLDTWWLHRLFGHF